MMSFANDLATHFANKKEKFETFKQIVDFVPVPMFLSSTFTGQCLYANKLYLDLVGKTLDEVLDDKWLTHVHQNDFDLVRNRWKMWVEDRTPYSIQVRYVHKDGSEVPVTVTASAVNGYTLGVSQPA